MILDVVDLREFYISTLGRCVRRLLRARLDRIWPDIKGETVLALGYATPLLRRWQGKAARILAMMPDTQGVAYWPREGPNISCLADLCLLPLPEESVSRVVMLHALENSSDPDAMLKEVWRVLKSGGRVLIIVPNRRGFWAYNEGTPFGSGKPYSSTQLRALLLDQGFFIERSWRALYWPPGSSRLSHVLAEIVERGFGFLSPAFGGILIVEAGKQIYAPTLVKAGSAKRRMVLPLSFPTTPGALPTG